jgi:hypothetical protein
VTRSDEVSVLGPSREGVSRRRLLQMAAALFVAGPSAALAQAKTPIADMHSHYGMVTRAMADSGLAADMRSQGVVLVAWKAIADQSWIHRTTVGIEQKSEPGPGDLARHFESTLGRMKASWCRRATPRACWSISLTPPARASSRP